MQSTAARRNGKQRGKHLATGVCRVSFGSVHLSADMRRAEHGTARKSKAVSHWRRWFIEVFSLHRMATQGIAVRFSALHGAAMHSHSKQRGQPFTEGCPSRFRLIDQQRMATHGIAGNFKQKQRGKAIQ